MKKEEKILTPISQEELEEKEYQKLINLDNELSSYGLSKIERQEIFSECNVDEIEELINQLGKECQECII